MSIITVVGNLVFEPEVKDTGAYNFTKLRVASNDRIKTPEGEWKDGDTTFLDVVAWRRLGKGAALLKKGQRVIVTGKLKGRSFVRNDGTNGYAYEIDATDIGVSVMPRPGEETTKPVVVEPDVDNPWE